MKTELTEDQATDLDSMEWRVEQVNQAIFIRGLKINEFNAQDVINTVYDFVQEPDNYEDFEKAYKHADMALKYLEQACKNEWFKA
jgi:hypothetical protein